MIHEALKYFGRIKRLYCSLGIVLPMVHRYLPTAVLLVWSVLGMVSCEVINPEEDIPAVIKINSIGVRSDQISTTGSLSANITDAWVLIDDNLLGVFELPATVPVLQTGNRKVTVFAGIKRNGIAASRDIYPFYDRVEFQMDLQPDSIYELTPVVKHTSPEEVEYLWVEDFEITAFGLDSLPDNDVDFFRTVNSDETFEGNASLGAILNPENPIFLVATEIFSFPTTGARVFLEMDYKCTVEMNIGVEFSGEANGTFEERLITLVPTVDNNGEPFWNKIYLDLSRFAVLDPTADEHRVLFGVDVSQSGESGEVYLDNLKIIHQIR